MVETNTIPILLNGREVATEVLKNVANEINTIKSNNKRVPGLAVLLVGDNPASKTYVNNKEKACNNIGIYSEVHKFQDNINQENLKERLEQLNNDNKIDGILLQLPLPSHLNSQKLINAINPKKDVDGLNPVNLGKLMSGQQCLKPCTPLGIIEILKHYSINITGAQVVVIGRSPLVGKPVSLLLLEKNASVTVVHSKSKNIEQITKTADILVCAIGKPKLVKKDWVKPGVIIIDVGINKITEQGKDKLVGDVDFEDVKAICKAITPVPGGVGPVTIAMLLSNTLEAYKNR